MRLFSVLTLSMFSFLHAPAQVQSSAYNLTLKALLSHSVPEVTVPQVKEMKGILLMDAREWNEYRVSHIKNATFVGYDQFEIDKLKSINKEQKIVVYCSVGYRSEKISEKLKRAGFINVSNLYGGIFEWVNQGNPVVDEKGKETDHVHAYSKTWGVWLNQGVKVYDPK
jgi:rhodanese-related sulfurtransferase